jgi:hypothetical protein
VFHLAQHHFILILLHQFVSNAQPLFVLIAMLFNPLHVFFVKMDIIYILELVLQLALIIIIKIVEQKSVIFVKL